MALNDIDTFVILMLENRSFDHMVGYLSLGTTPSPMPVDGLSDDPAWLQAHANPAPNGPPIPPYLLSRAVQTIDDPLHDRDHIAIQINTPPQPGPPALMGGFVKSYALTTPEPKDLRLAMGYYTTDAVQTFDFLARTFVVCDHWFSALPSGTQPNRLMAMSGTSLISDNAEYALPNQPLVYDWLYANNIDWCSYQWAGFPFFTLMPDWAPKIIGSLNDPYNLGPFRRYEGFHDQWISDRPTIPSVVFIEPKYTDDKISWSAPNDDHPPTGIAKGQDLVRRVYQTLISNPERWARTLMIVTYDEHGGFFDHVAPLPIADTAGGYRFTTTGPRVPSFIASPQVAKGTPFTGKLDHTSILQLLADRFTPGQPYSAAVAARQQYLEPLRNVIVDPPPAVAPVPQLPDDVHAKVQVLAAVAPISPVGPDAPKDSETAVAFDRVAHEIAAKHPDLLQGPYGQAIADYVARSAPGGVRKGLEKAAKRPKAAGKPAVKAKPKAKIKPKAKTKRKGKAKRPAARPAKRRGR